MAVVAGPVMIETEISSPHSAFVYFKGMCRLKVEEVWVLALTTHLVPLGTKRLFRGTVDSCLLHPRDVLRFLIQKNASAFVLSHNHPLGPLRPSSQDLQLTRSLATLSQHLQICFCDHLIVAGNGKFMSLRDAHPEIFLFNPERPDY